MKVLVLACLVALALGGEKEEVIVSTETVESLSSSEDFAAHSSKQKSESLKHEEQQREDKSQEKLFSFFQPQPAVYPWIEPFRYSVFPLSAMPLAQRFGVLPIPQSEIIEVPEPVETVFPRQKVMPILKFPTMPSIDFQIPNLSNLENLPLALPLLQPLRHQLRQPLGQFSVLSSQPLSSALPIPQQVIAYPPSIAYRPLYQEPQLDSTSAFYPVAQPVAPVYNPINV